MVVVGLLACWAEIESLRLVGSELALPVGAAFMAAQWPLRRFKETRPWRLAWLTGSQAVTVFVCVVYLVLAIKRFA